MRFNIWTIGLLFFISTLSLALPQPITDIQLISPDVAAALDRRNNEVFGDVKDLGKRKGGGGGGGKGGGGGSSSGGSGSEGSGSSGSGSTGSGSSSSGSSSSGSSSSAGKGSSSSSSGGSTKTGSGVTPAYGGGRYYGGGATTPYRAGGRSPLGIAPVFLAVGALAFFPGIWLYGAYAYPYSHPYTFHNYTATENSTNNSNTVQTRQTTLAPGVNQTKPVTCLCAAYQTCGCDDNDDPTFLAQLIGNGSYAALNKTLVTVADVNGTSTIIINGTLPNGTTSSGGTDSVGGAVSSFAHASGYWVMIALVGCTVLLV